MAYDEALAERIRHVLGGETGVSEKKMFGGIAFMVRGHMFVGIVKDDLMVRVGPEAYPELVRRPHARRMDFTGKPMKGFVFVAPPGCKGGADLRRWMKYGLQYAASLPTKASTSRRPASNRTVRRTSARRVV